MAEMNVLKSITYKEINYRILAFQFVGIERERVRHSGLAHRILLSLIHVAEAEVIPATEDEALVGIYFNTPGNNHKTII